MATTGQYRTFKQVFYKIQSMAVQPEIKGRRVCPLISMAMIHWFSSAPKARGEEVHNMSKVQTAAIECPACGTTHNFSFYSSVDVALNPELKEKVVDGSIFLLQCPSCGETFKLRQPLLYVDPEHRMAVWLMPEELLDDLRPVMESVRQTLGENVRTRLVHTEEELTEKIHILEAGLNDWAIQMLKAEYVRPENEATESPWYFLGIQEDADGEKYLHFECPETGEAYGMQVEAGVALSADLDVLGDETPWAYVNDESLKQVLPA
jgi:predicted RNA-binding Zn-ribbon protein involved in translation (DUF1610 family)